MATIEKREGKRGNTWRVRVRRSDGPWLTKSFTRKADAEAWARSIEGKLDSGEALPSSEARKRTLADAIDRYLTVTLPRSKHRKNEANQNLLLGWWREHLGERTLVSLTPAVIAEARDSMAEKKSRTGKPISGATVNRYLTALSAALRVTVKEYGWIPKNPVLDVTRLEDSKGRERFLSTAERTRLLEACKESPCPAVLPLVELALATGARKGELLGLQWENVDLANRRVRFVDTKNGENRTVPLAQTAVATLRTWRGKKPKIAGPVFDHANVERVWREARDAAGLNDFRFHDLRHSAASYLAMSGASLMDIAAILGHKTLAMVKRYSHLSEQHTTAAVDRMAAKFLDNGGRA